MLYYYCHCHYHLSGYIFFLNEIPFKQTKKKFCSSETKFSKIQFRINDRSSYNQGNGRKILLFYFIFFVD